MDGASRVPTIATPRKVYYQQRRLDAMKLRLGGATYREIAEKLNIRLQSAHEFVRRTLEENNKKLREDVEQLRAIELARLDSMTVALWPGRSSPRVADTLIRIGERRARLLGLDAPSEIPITMPVQITSFRLRFADGREGAPEPTTSELQSS